MDTAAVWANEPAPESPKRERNEMLLVFSLAAIVMVAGGWRNFLALLERIASSAD